MNDYLSTLPSTLQWVTQQLANVPSIPWPLWLGGLFPIYAAALSFFLWFMRGSVWPVRCAYPKTSRRRPCENWVPGEWHRCRYHNYRARYRYGHTVDPRIRRWQQVNRKGELIDLPAIGMGTIRTRPAGHALLYENGYARKPLDVLKIVPDFAAKMYNRLRSARIRSSANTDPPIDPADVSPMRDALAADLAIVVSATRMALGAFGFALSSTLVSVFLAGTAQAVAQWISTLGFVVAWAAVNSGIYHRHFDWRSNACAKAIKWWATIFAPVALINLVFAAANA